MMVTNKTWGDLKAGETIYALYYGGEIEEHEVLDVKISTRAITLTIDHPNRVITHYIGLDEQKSNIKKQSYPLYFDCALQAQYFALSLEILKTYYNQNIDDEIEYYKNQILKLEKRKLAI